MTDQVIVMDAEDDTDPVYQESKLDKIIDALQESRWLKFIGNIAMITICTGAFSIVMWVMVNGMRGRVFVGTMIVGALLLACIAKITSGHNPFPLGPQGFPWGDYARNRRMEKFAEIKAGAVSNGTVGDNQTKTNDALDATADVPEVEASVEITPDVASTTLAEVAEG